MPDKTFTEAEFDRLYLNDRDHNSFTRTDEDYAARRVTGKFDSAPAGLSKNFKVTTQDITTTASKLPATPLTDRNTLSIHNKSTTDTLFIGEDNTVTADSVDGITSGWEVPPGGVFNTDIKTAIELWGISTATIKVKILELA